MKKIFRIIGVGVIIFIIGGLGGLMIDYVIFAKAITHPVWSQNKIIKAIDDRVSVVKTVEKVIVADNESIADIANRAASTVVYVETIKADGTQVAGNGVVISSDGVIATTREIVATENEAVYIRLADDTVYDVKSIFVDNYSGVVFLRIDAENLATISFANSDDARSGKRLISIARSALDDDARFALGGFFGRDSLKSIALPMSDFLQGVLLVDFSQNILASSIGSPVVDFHGNMLGLVSIQNSQTVTNEKEFYAIASNDVSNAFESFLQNQDAVKLTNVSLGIDYTMIDVVDAHISDREITSGAVVPVAQTYVTQGIFAQTVAARSGLRGGDIIVMVNNEKVDKKNNLSRLMYKYRNDDKIVLDVLRGGKSMLIDVIKDVNL